jgi:hypothetical protein
VVPLHFYWLIGVHSNTNVLLVIYQLSPRSSASLEALDRFPSSVLGCYFHSSILVAKLYSAERSSFSCAFFTSFQIVAISGRDCWHNNSPVTTCNPLWSFSISLVVVNILSIISNAPYRNGRACSRPWYQLYRHSVPNGTFCCDQVTVITQGGQNLVTY